MTITKATLVKDFENGRCAIRWDRISSRATAVYLDGHCLTIRFDTYCSVRYSNSTSPCPKGFSYLSDYTFWNMETAKAFQSKFTDIRIVGEAYIWGVRSRFGSFELDKKFQTREQAERGAWEHPFYRGKLPLVVFNERTGEEYPINKDH